LRDQTNSRFGQIHRICSAGFFDSVTLQLPVGQARVSGSDTVARVLRGTGQPPTLQAIAIRHHVARAHDTRIYGTPLAIVETFTRSSDNMPSYEGVSAELAGYCTPEVRSMLDISCGDGHTVFPALDARPPACAGALALWTQRARRWPAPWREPKPSSPRCPFNEK